MCWCGDGPDVFEQRTIKARKPHECSECLRDIAPGEMYVRSDGLWDGTWAHFATCVRCDALAMEVMRSGGCFSFGMLMDELDERDATAEQLRFLHERDENYERRKLLRQQSKEIACT